MRVIGAIIVCAILAIPLRGTDARPAQLSSPGEELALAEQALRIGHVDAGLKGLEKAASQHNLKAQLRLAQIYREGKLVSRDELKACELYGEAADAFAGLDPKHTAAPLVGEAFRSWAKCYVKGIAQPGWERNMTRAAELFYQAGVIFGDAPALFELAQLYLSGQGISQNTKLGVWHLYTASRKRYPPAQARLGNLLWEGKVVKRHAGPGLALLILAKEGAASEDRAWIASLYDDAMITATEAEEAEALKIASEWRNSYGPDQTNAVPLSTNSIPLPQRPPTRFANPPGADGEEQQNKFRNRPTGGESVSPDQ